MTDFGSSDFITPTSFTDAVIEVQNVHFYIHKIIMCKCSPVFKYVGTSIQYLQSHLLPHVNLVNRFLKNCPILSQPQSSLHTLVKS